MRLSEAMALGRTLIKFHPGKYLEKGEGCFFGMAGAAHGRTYLQGHVDGSMPITVFLGTEYPWALSLRVEHPWRQSKDMLPVFSIINSMAHLVATGKYTAEQVIDWVRSVEPQEEPSKAQQQKPAEEVVCALSEAMKQGQRLIKFTNLPMGLYPDGAIPLWVRRVPLPSQQPQETVEVEEAVCV